MRVTIHLPSAAAGALVLASLALLTSALRPAQEAEEAPRWDYRMLQVSDLGDPSDRELLHPIEERIHEMGNEGYELDFSYMHNDSGKLKLVFKRPHEKNEARCRYCVTIQRRRDERMRTLEDRRTRREREVKARSE